jgi:cation:H+ antiporter
VVLLAATTSLPELFTGLGATAVFDVPDIAVGDVLGSCMFNLLILSAMDAVQPEPLSARAHQGHVLSIGFGCVMVGVAGLGLRAASLTPAVGWIGIQSLVLIVLYLVAMRVIFTHEQRRLAAERREIAEKLEYREIPTRTAVWRYCGAAVLVVGAALMLPRLAADIADQTGLGDAFVGSLMVAITTSLPEIVVSLAAVRIGAVELGLANVLGSNLFNMLILGLDDVFYTKGPLLADAAPIHTLSVLAVVIMNATFLIGLTYQVAAKRFAVAWDTAAIAAVYLAVTLLQYWS